MAAINQCRLASRNFSQVGFGEVVPEFPGYKQLSLAQKIARVELPIITALTILSFSASIGFVLGGVLGALSGVGVGLSLVFAGCAAFLGYRARYSHRYNPPSTSALVFPDDIPQLGEFYGGNSVLVTNSSKETTEWKLDLIDHVEQSLEISASIAGGPTFREALEKIEKVLNRKPHVKAHLMTTDDLLERQDIKFLKRLVKQYPGHFRYCITPLTLEMYPKPHFLENHVKFFVVDEKYFVIGGTNFQEELTREGLEIPTKRKGRKFIQDTIGSASRDVDIVGYGPVAKTLRREFFKLYANWEYRMAPKKPNNLNNYYEPIVKGDKKRKVASFAKLKRENKKRLVHDVRIKLVVSGPENPFNNCTEEYARVILGVNHDLKIANMFFTPAPEIIEALGKVSEECAVTLITNSKGKTGPPSGKFYVAGNRLYYPLIMKGEGTRNRIFEYSVPDTIYHKKVLTADKEITLMGSYNTGAKSHLFDYEIVLTIESKEVAKKIEETLEKDLEKDQQGQYKYVRELSYKEVKKISSRLKTKFPGRLQSEILLI